MFYLKILFLVSYFLIIFVFFRISSSLHQGTFKLSNEWLSSFTSMFTNIILGRQTRETTKQTNETLEPLNAADEEVDDASVELTEETQFIGYQDFIEKVEDTKASVWVVRIYPPTAVALDNAKEIKEWPKMSKRLRKYGIKTGSYHCIKDIRLCLIHKVTVPTILLTMPKGSHPKGNVAFHLFHPGKTSSCLIKWVQKRLYQKVKTVHSISEITERPVGRLQKRKDAIPSMYFVYKSKVPKPPLLLSALSVRFTGRIKFYMLKTDDQKEETQNILAINQFSKYSYGQHKGENFTYSCMELFLKTLHPEVNDIFIASVILLNMACWFEVSLQKGGPLRRLLFYIWGFATSNVLLVTIWLPLLKLIYMPQVQPIVEVCLQNLQKMMFTNAAAIVRQDFLELSKHLYVVIFGFLCYGIFLGYLHFKFRNGSNWASNTSISEIFEHDVEDLQELFRSLLLSITPTLRIYRFEASIERILHTLSSTELWLPTESPTEYIKELPTWKYCSHQYEVPVEISENERFVEESESGNSSSKQSVHKTEICEKNCEKSLIPNHVLKVHNCVICLEDYKCQIVILGLPCGHSFHQNCAYGWLVLEGAQNRCPMCRWPCNIKKGTTIEIVDTLE